MRLGSGRAAASPPTRERLASQPPDQAGQVLDGDPDPAQGADKGSLGILGDHDVLALGIPMPEGSEVLDGDIGGRPRRARTKSNCIYFYQMQD